MSDVAPINTFRHFRPPGPVTAAFLEDRTSKVRALRGPVGGGKTVTCIFDCLRNTHEMPVCLDGWVHYRVAVIGVTYGQLERNLYPTWHGWLPKDPSGWTEGEWEGGGGRFARQVIKFQILRKGKLVPVRFEAIFAAIGEASVEQFVRGFEPTAWYLYEMDQLPDGVVEAALGRLSRYPNATMLGHQPDYRSYVIGDLNAPDIDSWYYNLFEVVRPEGYRQYEQPSGLSPKAENLQNLAVNYYQDLLKLNAHRTRWVRRFLSNEYGPSDVGNPVYGEEYSDSVHLVSNLEALKGVPLRLGFDQGRNGPAMVIGQRDYRRRMRILGEHSPGRSNPRNFARECMQLIAEIAPGIPLPDVGYCDPAGWQGSDKQGDELGWAEVVSKEMGIPILPAPTNALDLRLLAVRDELSDMIDGLPAIMISRERCPILRKGFVSHYMFEKRKPDQSQPLVPIKNEYSNPHDALQYLLLGERGRYGVIEGKRGDGARRRHGDDDDNCVLPVEVNF